jgi:hypothetical protein
VSSTEFESFIRPFQTSSVTPAQTYYTPAQIGVPNIILRIGRSGSGKVFTGSYSASETHYMTVVKVEKKLYSQLSEGETRDYSKIIYDSFYGNFGQGVIGDPMSGK